MNMTAIPRLAGAQPPIPGMPPGASSDTDGFATQFAACCAATTAAGDGVGHGEAGDRPRTDVLTLAALASRTATAVLPLLTTVLPAAVDATADAEQLAADQPDGVVPVTDGAVTLVTSEAEEGDEPAAASADGTRPTTEAAPQVGIDPAEATEGAVTASGEPTRGAADSRTPAGHGGGATTQDRTTIATEVVAPGAAEEAGEPGVEAATEPAAGTTTGPAVGSDLDGATPAPATTRDAGQPSAVSTASTVEDQVDPVVLPAASARGREPREAAVTRAPTPVSSRVDGAEAPAPTGTAVPTSTGRTDPLVPSAAAQRVLDIVTQLEDAPPPRVVVIETGEMRVRVGLDGGVVRLTVLGALPEGGEEFLRETADALEAGGFGAEFDGAGGDPESGDRYADDGVPGASATSTSATAARPGRARSGLQL